MFLSKSRDAGVANVSQPSPECTRASNVFSVIAGMYMCFKRFPAIPPERLCSKKNALAITETLSEAENSANFPFLHYVIAEGMRNEIN